MLDSLEASRLQGLRPSSTLQAKVRQSLAICTCGIATFRLHSLPILRFSKLHSEMPCMMRHLQRGAIIGIRTQTCGLAISSGVRAPTCCRCRCPRQVSCAMHLRVNLLDSGSFAGREPRRHEADYEPLWHAACKFAFPGRKPEARALRQATSSAEPNFTRDWVHSVCKSVNDLRNRVAHHEPIVNGFPSNGQHARMSAREGHEQCMLLARMIDRDLAKWLVSNSTVPALLVARPH